MEEQHQTTSQVSAGEEMVVDISACQVQHELDSKQDDRNSKQRKTKYWSCNFIKEDINEPLPYASSWTMSPNEGDRQPSQSEWSWSPVMNSQRRYAGRWSWSPTQLTILPYYIKDEGSTASEPSESLVTRVNCWPIFVNTYRSKRKRRRCRRKRSLKSKFRMEKKARDWRNLASVTELVPETKIRNLIIQDKTLGGPQISDDIKNRNFYSCETEMRLLNPPTHKQSGILLSGEGIGVKIGTDLNITSTVDGQSVKIASPQTETEGITAFRSEVEEIQSNSLHSQRKRLTLPPYDELFGQENSACVAYMNEVAELPTENQYPLCEHNKNNKLKNEVTKLLEVNYYYAKKMEADCRLPTSKKNMAERSQNIKSLVSITRELHLERNILLEVNEVNDQRTKASSSKHEIKLAENCACRNDTVEMSKIQDETSYHLPSSRQNDAMLQELSLDPSLESEKVKSKVKNFFLTEINSFSPPNTNVITNDKVIEQLSTDSEPGTGKTESLSPAAALEETQQRRYSHTLSPVNKLVGGGIGRSLSLELLHEPGDVSISGEAFCGDKQLQSSASCCPHDLLTVMPSKMKEFNSYKNVSQSGSLFSVTDSFKSGNRISMSSQKHLSENLSWKYNNAKQVCEILFQEKDLTPRNSTASTVNSMSDEGMLMPAGKESEKSFPNQSHQGTSTATDDDNCDSQDFRRTSEDPPPKNTLWRTPTLIFPSPVITRESNISSKRRTDSLHPVCEIFENKDNETRKSSSLEEVELVSTWSNDSSANNAENIGVSQKDLCLYAEPESIYEGMQYQEILKNNEDSLCIKHNISESQAQKQEKYPSVMETVTTMPTELTSGSHKREKCSSLEREVVRQKSCYPAKKPTLQTASSSNPSKRFSLKESMSIFSAEEPRQGLDSQFLADECSLQEFNNPPLTKEPSLLESATSAAEPRQNINNQFPQLSNAPLPKKHLHREFSNVSSAEKSQERSVTSLSADVSQQSFKSSSFDEKLQHPSRSSSVERTRQRCISLYSAGEPLVQEFSTRSPGEESQQALRSSSTAEKPSLQGSSSPSSAEEPREKICSPSTADIDYLKGFRSSFPADKFRQEPKSSSSVKEPLFAETSSSLKSFQGLRIPSPAEEPVQESRSQFPGKEFRQESKNQYHFEKSLLWASRSPLPTEEIIQDRSINPIPAEKSRQISKSLLPAALLSLQKFTCPPPLDETLLQGSRSSSPAEKPLLHKQMSSSSVVESSQRVLDCLYPVEEQSPTVPTSLPYSFVSEDGYVAFPLGGEVSDVTSSGLPCCSYPDGAKETIQHLQSETDNEPVGIIPLSTDDGEPVLVDSEYSYERGGSGVKRKNNAEFEDNCKKLKKPSVDHVDIIKNILSEVFEVQTSQGGVHRKRMVTRAVSRKLARRLPNHNLQHVAAARKEIFIALKSGNFERMRELLQDTGPNVRHEHTHCTLLHAAAEHQQVDMMLYLLKVISPNVVNKDCRTPAHLAARNGHTQILRILLADPEMDPAKRDNFNKTYKQCLAFPLLEAVLQDNRIKVQELLRLGADPDCTMEPLWEGTAAREVHVTTARELAYTLHRDAILSLMKRRRVDDEIEENEPGVSMQIEMLLRKHSGKNKEIKQCVDTSPADLNGEDVYRMDANPKGYVFLLSYGSFKGRPDLHLEGSETDVQNLANVFSQMGYSGHAHFSLTAKQTRQQLSILRDNKMLEQAGCAIFVISSHGASHRSFLTSDMEIIDTQWVLDFFKDSQCSFLRNKPKIFIWNLCHGHLRESNRGGNQVEVCGRVNEPLRDVMCLYSNTGGFSWYSFSENGTPFIEVLCRTLARHANTKELSQLYRDFLCEYTQLAPDAVPQLTNHGFRKGFYFTRH